MSWMIGIATTVAAVTGLLIWARAAWRRSVRDELKDFMAESYPGWTVRGEGGDWLEVEAPDDAGLRINLFNLFSEASQIRTADAAADARARREVYEAFLQGAAEQLQAMHSPLGPESVARVMPMLVDSGFLDALKAKGSIPSHAVGDTGLSTVYVLDSAQAVSYLTQDRLAEMGLDAEAARDVALSNLRGRTSEEPVRVALAQRSVVMVKTGDAFDATRALLVPEQLAEHEQLAVLVPDRDTLVLAPVPDDGDWTRLESLAGGAGSERVVSARPLLVSRDAIRAV